LVVVAVVEVLPGLVVAKIRRVVEVALVALQFKYFLV
jgi:hypothetical protein